MAKQSKSKREAYYYIPTRSQAITWSSRPTSEFLTRIHRQYPNATISKLRTIITEESDASEDDGAVAVLDAYIRAGYSEYVPDWI